MSPLILLACSGDEPAAPPPSRVNAVTAAPAKEVRTDEFCESRPGVSFAWPELDEPAPAPASTWRWVNVWATWCKPCIEEMPMLARWRQKLADAGAAVDLRFLSVDADIAALTAYKAAHAEAKDSLHLKDMKLLAGWLPTVGLDASAVLPVHLFVDPTNTIRCQRQGSVGPDDFDVVRRVLTGG